MIQLIPYSKATEIDQQLETYTLPEHQIIFSGLPKEAIEIAVKDTTRHPILLTDKEQVTTFFILQKKEEALNYTDNKQAMLLRSFSTAEKYQGKGYATLALTLLPAYVNKAFPDKNELVLAVNSRNHSAIQLYKKCGYLDTKKRRKTAYGELLILSKSL